MMCASEHCSLLKSKKSSRNESPKQSSIKEIIACVTKNQTVSAVHHCILREDLSFAAQLIEDDWICKLRIWFKYTSLCSFRSADCERILDLVMLVIISVTVCTSSDCFLSVFIMLAYLEEADERGWMLPYILQQQGWMNQFQSEND